MAEPTIPAQPDRPERIFSSMFERLVERSHPDSHELVGLVAYGIYKRAKREWADRLQARTGRTPSPEELNSFIEYWTETRLRALREEASSVLVAFSDHVLKQEESRIIRDALRGSFWRGVTRSVLAALIYTLVLIAAAIAFLRAGVNLQTLSNLIGS